MFLPHPRPYTPRVDEWAAFAASKQDTLNLGLGTVSALVAAVNSDGGFPTINGTLVSGNCLQWSPTGMQTTSAPCGSGGGGGTWNGAFPVTVSGVNSGGVPYFSSSTQMQSSAPLTANSLMVGGGAGQPPKTFTLAGDCAFNYPNVTCASLSGIAPGPFYSATTVNLATQSAGNLASSHLDSGINADMFHCLTGSPIVGGAWQPCSGQTGYALPANPSGTASSTFVMMGLGITFIPKKGGDVAISVSGSIANSGSAACAYVLYYGTGTAPTNGVAPPIGAKQLGAAIPTPAASVISANGTACFTNIGTAYWVDLAVRAPSGGTCTPANVMFSSIEN